MKDRVFQAIAPVWVLLAVGCGGAGDSAKAPVAESPAASPAAQPVEAEARAVARIEAKSGSSLGGTATFTAKDGTVRLELEVQGAPPGDLAVHLHEIGDCSAEDGSSAGPHWNPGGHEHGRWGSTPFHLGDVGNVQVGPDGTGSLTLTTDLWSIGSGDTSDIVGRALVVHEKADDFMTQPTGAAGGRIGCGVIE